MAKKNQIWAIEDYGEIDRLSATLPSYTIQGRTHLLSWNFAAPNDRCIKWEGNSGGKSRWVHVPIGDIAR